MARTAQPSIRRKARLAAAAKAAREANRPGSASLGARVGAIPRMVMASMGGRYPGLSRLKLMVLGLGVGYVVSPIDAVPELLLGPFGLADDLVLTMTLVGTLLSEADEFLRWEAAQTTEYVDNTARR